jgi:flavodoxin
MKALVVYDSAFGNTEKVAQTIGQTLGPPEDVEIARAGNVRPEQLAGLAMLPSPSPISW